MARTILKDKVALVAGVDNPLGRACAQQLSREGCRVILAGSDEARVLALGEQLLRKKGDSAELVLPPSRAVWPELVVEARKLHSHIHLFVNALAFSGLQDEGARSAAEVMDRAVEEHVAPRGPLRALTLWPAEEPAPPASRAPWSGVVKIGPRATAEGATDPAAGPAVLRPGAIGDSVLCLLLIPPSACPAEVHLRPVEKPAGGPQ